MEGTTKLGRYVGHWFVSRQISLPRFGVSGDYKGFAFVELGSEVEAQRVCAELNGTVPPGAPHPVRIVSRKTWETTILPAKQRPAEVRCPADVSIGLRLRPVLCWGRVCGILRSHDASSVGCGGVITMEC